MVRASNPAAGLRDGALFAFAVGTVPDLIVALEARDGDSGRPA